MSDRGPTASFLTDLAAPGEERPASDLLAGEVNEALCSLSTLSISNLRIRWRELFGRSAPIRLGPELMKQAIGYRLQEMAHGGLNRTARLRLNAAAKYAGSAPRTIQTGPLIKSGTRFVREWKGEAHEVVAAEGGGFAYRGVTYDSLSMVTRKITGAHQSGPRFFGLKVTPAQPMSKEAADG